jgi:hypothetical protein
MRELPYDELVYAYRRDGRQGGEDDDLFHLFEEVFDRGEEVSM